MEVMKLPLTCLAGVVPNLPGQGFAIASVQDRVRLGRCSNLARPNAPSTMAGGLSIRTRRRNLNLSLGGRPGYCIESKMAWSDETECGRMVGMNNDEMT